MSYFKSTFSGHIPERLKYVQRPARMVTDYWEHDLWDADDKKRPGVMLRETFVVDIESKKSLETATSWAQRACQVYENGKYVTRGEILITERANDPIPAIEIISLDVRDEVWRQALLQSSRSQETANPLDDGTVVSMIDQYEPLARFARRIYGERVQSPGIGVSRSKL